MHQAEKWRAHMPLIYIALQGCTGQPPVAKCIKSSATMSERLQNTRSGSFAADNMEGASAKPDGLTTAIPLATFSAS